MRLANGAALAFWLLLLALPPVLLAMGEPFFITYVTRLMIFALAASSLNLVLGYGGMVSFGHAAFFGMGGYTVAILAHQYGITAAWITWPLAMVVAALLGLVIGAISLRTRSVYFIMITLAFAQMLFYIFTSLRVWGGQDGMTMARSTLIPAIDLADNTTFYYVTLAMLAASLFLFQRIIGARFGHVLQSIKQNETRVAALGYSVYRFQLVGFVIGAAFAGLAGVLNTNLNTFISPSSLAWFLSGQLMMMVILGGVGRFWGGTVGAFAFLLVETGLESVTDYWQLAMGILLLVIVLVAPQGIVGLRLRRAAPANPESNMARAGEAKP